MTTQLQFNLMPERRVWSVTELTVCIRDLLARNFTDILVEGEISNCREASSGHIYCTLKDERTQIRCVCFKTQLRTMKFRPEDGLRVTVRGSITVEEAPGSRRLVFAGAEKAFAGAAALHWIDHLTAWSGGARCGADFAAAISQCAAYVVSGSGAGRRGGRRDCARV